jgi:hypothetical protein
MKILIASRICTDQRASENERLEVCTPMVVAVESGVNKDQNAIRDSLVESMKLLASVDFSKFRYKTEPAAEFARIPTCVNPSASFDERMANFVRYASNVANYVANNTRNAALYICIAGKEDCVEVYRVSEV